MVFFFRTYAAIFYTVSWFSTSCRPFVVFTSRVRILRAHTHRQQLTKRDSRNTHGVIEWKQFPRIAPGQWATRVRFLPRSRFTTLIMIVLTSSSAVYYAMGFRFQFSHRFCSKRGRWYTMLHVVHTHTHTHLRDIIIITSASADRHR